MKLFFRYKTIFHEEHEIVKKYFEVVNCRSALMMTTPKYPILSKYSTNSNYVEYCEDLKNFGLTPINSPTQFHWSSKVSHWYYDIENHTPKSWFNPFTNPHAIQILKNHNGPFFVRFDTKSKRELWKTHAYAEDFSALKDVCLKLGEDYKFENETLVIREFLRLKKFAVIDKHCHICHGDPEKWKICSACGYHTQFSGQPVVKEFRIHRLLKEELCRHFYWEPFQEEIENQYGKIDCNEIPSDWLKRITDIADSFSNFYAIDVAQLEDGSWIVIEINEGQHSGVHTDCLDEYYRRLKEVMEKNYG